MIIFLFSISVVLARGFYALQELGMYAGDCHRGHAFDADYELAGVLDALDVALEAAVQALRDLEPVAYAPPGGLAAEIFGSAAREHRGLAEDFHLAVPYPGRLIVAGGAVVEELVAVFALVAHQEALAAAHEEQGGDHGLLYVFEFAFLEFLNDRHRDIGLVAGRLEIGLDLLDPVVEHLEGEPVSLPRPGHCKEFRLRKS